MKRADFTLFWSMPPTPEDWQNLSLSGVQRLMLPLSLAHARPDILTRLHSEGKRLIVRLEETYYDADAPQRVAEQVKAVKRMVDVDAVILGVEPDHWNPQTNERIDMSYSSLDWGQERARIHAGALVRVREALRDLGLGIQLISPGWTAGRKHEIDELQPGKQAWRIEVGEAYAQCDGNGGHVYLHDFSRWVDEIRFLYQVNELAEMFHRPIYLDEVGITAGSDVEQMTAYIRMAQMLGDEQWEAGRRVVMFCPFVANGDPYVRDANGSIIKRPDGTPETHWNPKYLLQDSSAYRLLGKYMSGS